MCAVCQGYASHGVHYFATLPKKLTDRIHAKVGWLKFAEAQLGAVSISSWQLGRNPACDSSHTSSQYTGAVSQYAVNGSPPSRRT